MTKILYFWLLNVKLSRMKHLNNADSCIYFKTVQVMHAQYLKKTAFLDKNKYFWLIKTEMQMKLINIVLLFSVDRNKYQIHIPLPPKIDPTVTMMQVEEKPDVTYSDVGGCKEQIEKLREVVETPLLHVGPLMFWFLWIF